MAHEIVLPQLQVPDSGVKLTGGPFGAGFENNIRYLKSLSLDSILYWFRRKAGLPAPGEPYRGHFEDEIKGQTAGLFLMGAANSLRWREDPTLRQEVEAVVDGIQKAAEPDGFFEPIPKSEFGTLEYPNYVRVWLNYGLKAASMVGYQQALPLMRRMQTWFNGCDERPLVKYLALAFQGIIANTTVARSEVGLPEDVDAVVKYYQEDWWLGQFIQGDQAAIYKRPTPHGTELEGITAYFDMYLLTGKAYYLNAVNGAYRMFQQKWQHVGGGIVAIEFTAIEPGCYWLDPVHKYNELCCSAHWLYLNQRYHLLYPTEERYVAEMEKTLYNIVIANQIGAEFIRYHAYIDIQKDSGMTTPVSCCAGLGTRILGSLPEFLYTLSPDGISVDIYSSSEILWKRSGRECRLVTRTGQPTTGDVHIRVGVPQPLELTIWLRMPSWTEGEVPVLVNGSQVAVGVPGSYCALTRSWRDGDTIELTLPMPVRGHRYTGLDSVAGFERYAFERGAILLACVGSLDWGGRYIQIDQDPVRPAVWLRPSHDTPGHYDVAGKPGYRFMPYYEVRNEVFTCYPIFQKPRGMS